MGRQLAHVTTDGARICFHFVLTRSKLVEPSATVPLQLHQPVCRWQTIRQRCTVVIGPMNGRIDGSNFGQKEAEMNENECNFLLLEQPLWWPSILALARAKFRPAVPGRAEIPLTLPEWNVLRSSSSFFPSWLHEKTMKTRLRGQNGVNPAQARHPDCGISALDPITQFMQLSGGCFRNNRLCGRLSAHRWH